MTEDSHIRARFFVTRRHVVIYATFHSAKVTLRWDRANEEDLPARHIRTLVANLPQLMAEGFNEVLVQSEIRDLDQEWLDMDEPPSPEEPND